MSPTVPVAAAALATLTSVVLAVAMLLRQRPTRSYHWAFSGGMVAFAAEAVASQRLLQRSDPSIDVPFWTAVLTVISLITCLTWMVFAAVFQEGQRRPRSARWWVGRVAGCLVVIPVIVALNDFVVVKVLRVDGFFELMTFGPGARTAIVVELLATVVILVRLELCLRMSKAAARWRLKYLVVGLGGIFLVRFYVLTSILLFNVLTAAYISTLAATVFVGNVVIAFALRRGVPAVGLALSRQLVFRSAIVGMLGAYLLSVGAMGWLLVRLGIPQTMFWGSLLVFVSGIVLAALLLSENLRWRVKRFIAMHVYRSKYDYREQWRSFTARLSSTVTPAECAPQFLQAVAEAVGATEAALYLGCPADGRYRCAATVGYRIPLTILEAESPLLRSLHAERRPTVLGDTSIEWGGDEALERFVSGFTLAVPLAWRESLSGVMLLGPERTGLNYGAEDLEFLATAAEQGAGVLAMAQLSERVAQAREFEAFHRLTSFVIHDIKNSVSSLSLLSRNALQNFEDPAFQRDALGTISSAVSRMRALLEKLSAPSQSESLELETVDLKAVADDVVRMVRQATPVRLLKDTEPVTVQGDFEALRRVVENLVSNAVQAGGRVTVKTCAQQGSAVIEVTDTGVGMSDEYVRESLFVPFRSTKPGGWGVGLYQAREIVQRHGGTISVASRRGEGTTFWVKLPVAAAAPGNAAQVVKNQEVRTGGR